MQELAPYLSSEQKRILMMSYVYLGSSAVVLSTYVRTYTVYTHCWLY